jgi:UDP-N-acetylglucosamine acyltransferase
MIALPRFIPWRWLTPRAELAHGVVIGPGAVIGPDVRIGANTWIGPHVVLDGLLRIGAHNRIYPGACLGQEPQDLKYKGAPTEVVIGDHNTIRECVTINRATDEGEQTRLVTTTCSWLIATLGITVCLEITL